MATKKSAKKSAKKSGKKAAKKSSKKKSASRNLSALAFRIDWVKDPGPDLRRFLDPNALRRLDALKRDFGAQVNQILRSGQR